MTATLNHDIFIPFFEEVRTSYGDSDPYSMLQFEGRCFPVKEYFLEDVLEWTGVPLGGPQVMASKQRGRAGESHATEIRNRLRAFSQQNYKDDTI